MGQLPDTGDVADRPQALAGLQARVDRDAVAVGGHADRLEAEVVDARPPPGRDEQAIAAQLAAVVELEDVLGAVAAGGRRPRIQRELDAVAVQHLAERIAERRGLARQHVPAALDERDLSPEAANSLRHLDPHRPAPEDQQPPRDRPSCRSPRGSSRCRRARAAPATGGMIGSAPAARTTCSAV